MGSIKQTFIKRTARDVMEADPDSFSDKFDENKAKLKDLDLIKSKHVRNRVAGYLVHLVKNKAF